MDELFERLSEALVRSAEWITVILSVGEMEWVGKW